MSFRAKAIRVRDALLDEGRISSGFVASAPGAQQTLDQFTWASKIPIEGTTSGVAEIFDDSRIHWLMENTMLAAPFDVLELGPLEGAHSAMLSAAGAKVRAVEANVSAYVKCLVVKDLLGLENVDFQLGEFNADMEQDTRRYDLLVACGVLYHMADPIRTICNMTARANEIFVWTHYFDDAAMPVGDPRRKAFRGEKKSFPYKGGEIVGEVQDYGGSTGKAHFWGGTHASSIWLSKADLFHLFEMEGFTIIEGLDEHDHPNGPAITFIARKAA